eukprot:Platyproteum_vivax@DN4959_c0_g1_i1.p1
MGEYAMSRVDALCTSLQNDHPVHRIAYVDDNVFINDSQERARLICDEARRELLNIGLVGNPQKDEKWSAQYFKHTEEQDWKKIKFLGSFIDTDTDVRNRIVGCRAIMSKYQKLVFRNPNASLDVKMAIFKGYILPILLFNSELWVMNQTICDKLDGFHRKALRHLLCIRYPKILSNDGVYEITNSGPLSNLIKIRRLNFFIRLLALPQNVPAQIVLDSTINLITQKIGQKQGKPHTKWFQIIISDIKDEYLKQGQRLSGTSDKKNQDILKWAKSEEGKNAITKLINEL